MYKKLLFFDFDGVVADSFQVALMIHRKVVPDVSEEEYRSRFNGNIYDSIDQNKHRFMDKDTFFMHYERHVYEQAIFPGIKDVLQKLSKDYNLVIVSSSINKVISLFIDHHGLNGVFSDIYGTDMGKSKVEKMEALLEKYKTKAENTLMVTDTLGDVREAAKLNIPSIAVSWGYHGEKTLSEEATLAIVHTPEQLESAIKKYFEHDQA